jgi:cell division protein FtsB
MTFRQTLSSKIALIGLVIMLALLIDWKYKQIKSENLIQVQKENLQQQADALEKKNNELSQSLQYLNSDSFKEGVARQQLDLKRQGETVYAFADAPQSTSAQTQNDSSESDSKKWLDYFFGN